MRSFCCRLGFYCVLIRLKIKDEIIEALNFTSRHLGDLMNIGKSLFEVKML